MRSSSRSEFVVGVVFVIVATIGSVLFGWDFGFSDTSQPLPFTIGAVAAVLAVVFTIRNR